MSEEEKYTLKILCDEKMNNLSEKLEKVESLVMRVLQGVILLLLGAFGTILYDFVKFLHTGGKP